MVKIHRIWFNTERMDREDHYKITLFSRPRVSIHVDEYIWSFIEENIVKPHKIDWSIVESFPFPAPFEEQRYIGDEGEIHVYSWDGRKETTLVGPYSVRKLYLEHFGES